MQTKEFYGYYSKNGIAVMWEAGGAGRNTGTSQVICGSRGQMKKALYIRKKGHLSNGEHALLAPHKEDHIIIVNQWRGNDKVEVHKIEDIEFTEEEPTIKTKIVHKYEEGTWGNNKPPAYLKKAIQKALNKAYCYHCRSPHYTRDGSEKVVRSGVQQ